MKIAFLFPGQGSQVVGMGKELAAKFPAAKQVFEEVDEVLGQSLSNIMFEGPMDDLTLTANAQPALMAMSMAIMRVLEKEGGLKIAEVAKFVAGHSLGEYSALVAAKSLSVADAALILRARGTAMQAAVPIGKGAMAAILGVDMDLAMAIASEASKGEVCSIANDNAVGQIVLSGTSSAILRAIEIAKREGAKRSLVLPVSAPFHCTMMAPAADIMANELAAIVINEPVVPLVSNVIAKDEVEPEELRELLVQQVTARVRWRESVLFIRDNGVDTLVEVGAGKVLTGLNRRIDREIKSKSIQAPNDIDSFLSSL